MVVARDTGATPPASKGVDTDKNPKARPKVTPRVVKNESYEPSTYDSKDFRKAGNPEKIAGKGGGLVYGSDGVDNTNKPRAIKNTFNERSSAELDKYKRLQSEVEQDISKYKDVRMRKIEQREEEKKQDLEMLKNYHPWGKEGAGAPRKSGDNMKKGIPKDAAEGADPYAGEYGNFHSQFGKPGAGAPLRTESGHIKAEMKTAADIRFRPDMQQMVDREVRYKAEPNHKQNYAHSLKQQLTERDMNEKQLKIQNLKEELQMIKHDPYGKPGCGAPNSRGVDGYLWGEQRRKCSLSADVVEMRRIEQKERELGLYTGGSKTADPSPRYQHAHREELQTYDPWGKGVGVVSRDDHGDVKRHKNGIITQDSSDPKINANMNSLPLAQGRGGCGAPIKDESGNIVTTKEIFFQKNTRGDATRKERPGLGKDSSDPEMQVYDPWGRGGAGAPMKDDHGQNKAAFTGQVNRLDQQVNDQQFVAKQQLLREQQVLLREQQKNKQAQNSELKYGGGEFASTMDQYQTGRPKRDPVTGMLVNQNKMTSDITKGGFMHLPMNHKSNRVQTAREGVHHAETEDRRRYHTELEKQAADRQVTKKLEHAKEVQEQNHHKTTFDSLWGRPGAGAPLPNSRKLNIDRILAAINEAEAPLPIGSYRGRNPGLVKLEELAFENDPSKMRNNPGLDKMYHSLERLPNNAANGSHNGSNHTNGESLGRTAQPQDAAGQIGRKVNLDKILYHSVQQRNDNDWNFDLFWGSRQQNTSTGNRKANITSMLHNGPAVPAGTSQTIIGTSQTAMPHAQTFDHWFNSPRKPQDAKRKPLEQALFNNTPRAGEKAGGYNMSTPWASEPGEVY